MDGKTVIVTGIGGNVGQGIIRNIRAMNQPIKIIGTNITQLSAGNHWVDRFHLVPYADNPSYIATIQSIITTEKADLIIPATDSEAHYLSVNSGQLGCSVAASPALATDTYLDKWKSYQKHLAHNIPFAESCLPSVYSGQFEQNIAKPRLGRGSKGIVRNIADPRQFADDEYIIQRLYPGLELTTAVYARYTDGAYHGLLSMARSLENGATTYCRTEPRFDAELKRIAKLMITHLGLRGSFNIQSMVGPDGQVIPFEVNCRISGTNSIRQAFGFKDVNYTIDELLWGKAPAQPVLIGGEAYRYLADVIYPDLEGQHPAFGDIRDQHIEF